MVGLDIRVKNEYNSYLKKLFESIDLSIYDWYIYWDELHFIENGKTITGFESSFLDGNSFVDAISKECYYMVFADFKAYLPGSIRTPTKTYEDFTNSECQIIFSCVDCTFIMIYCKNIDILKKIYANCLSMNVDSVKYTSAEDVKGRTISEG